MAAIAPGVPTWALVYGHMPCMLNPGLPPAERDRLRPLRQKGRTDRPQEQALPCALRRRCASGLQPGTPVSGDRAGEVPADAGVLLFTIETKEQAAKVIDRYRKGETWPGEFTRGLYYKGTKLSL